MVGDILVVLITLMVAQGFIFYHQFGLNQLFEAIKGAGASWLTAEPCSWLDKWKYGQERDSIADADTMVRPGKMVLVGSSSCFVCVCVTVVESCKALYLAHHKTDAAAIFTCYFILFLKESH